MKNLKLLGLTALLAVPMMISCNPDSAKNTLTYGGQTEFVIDNDQIELSLNLKQNLNEGETIDEITVEGIHESQANWSKAVTDVSGKTVKVTLGFDSFDNDSVVDFTKLTVRVIDKTKAEVCKCVIPTLKVSWVSCKETIRPLFKSVTTTKAKFPIQFKAPDISSMDGKKVYVYATVIEATKGTVTLDGYSVHAVEPGSKGMVIDVEFDFKFAEEDTEAKFIIGVYIAVYNDYLILSDGGSENFEITYKKSSFNK